MFCSTLGRRLSQHLQERPAGLLVSLFRILPRHYNRPATVTSSRLVPVTWRQVTHTRRGALTLAGLSLGLLQCSNDSNQVEHAGQLPEGIKVYDDILGQIIPSHSARQYQGGGEADSE